jgi:hypothetical protein
MADEPKITPDAPPAQPFNVRVSPDPPPAVPFDVPNYPDGPPARPFDVKVTPDGPPLVPFDVPTNPDSPPAAPFNVPTRPDAPPVSPHQVPNYPDAPPSVPFDVPTNPDGPPGVPYDVPTTPDGPPAVPYDVPTAPDGPPGVPFNVPTYPDGPPSVPFDVLTTPDGPPAVPVDVAVSPDAPPAAPFDVPTYPDLPALQIPGQAGDTPTAQEIINAVSRFDSSLGGLLNDLFNSSPLSISTPYVGALDPVLLADWFVNYQQAVGSAGVAKFIAEQSVLYAMNPVAGKVFDPGYFIAMAIPGSMGNYTTTIDVAAGINTQTVALAADAALTLEVSSSPLAGEDLNTYGPRNTFKDGQDFTVDDLVDATLSPGGGTSASSRFLKSVPAAAGIGGSIQRFDATKYFQDRDPSGGSTVRGTVKALAASGVTQVFSTTLARSSFIDGVVRVPVGSGETADGTVRTTSQDPSGVAQEEVDDDDARIPLCFTDLRKDPKTNSYRSVYFRPLNLNFSEAFAPEYSEEGVFGRVDPVIAYRRTTRTANVSFEVHAFAVEDLQVMYNKMVWLSSMVYPSYGSDSLIQSGPVCRLRVGDVISSDEGGIPGVIKSLNFDYGDALWELRKGMKVPRSFKVSLDYTFLHEGPVGLLNGVFGVFQLPGTMDQNTNLLGGPTDSRDGTVPITQSTMLPGKFRRFGEPKG